MNGAANADSNNTAGRGPDCGKEIKGHNELGFIRRSKIVTKVYKSVGVGECVSFMRRLRKDVK